MICREAVGVDGSCQGAIEDNSINIGEKDGDKDMVVKIQFYHHQKLQELVY